MIQKIVRTACLVLAAALFCMQAMALDADAARFGGGKSFGGKSSYSRTAPAPQTRQQPGTAYNNRQTQAQNPATGALAGSGFRGMLGGLLAGTLLGSLLFGGGWAGGGMMDIVLIALVAFLALKLLRMLMNRRPAAETVGGNARAAGDFSSPPDPWQRARETPGNGFAAPSGGPDIRLDGFDQDDFLRGAKVIFSRLQDSWDKRDVDDIATFATAAIVNEVKAQAEADPDPSKTEVMLVNASLVSAERDGGEDVVTVFFDVLLRENPDAQIPSQIRELWHFTRPAGSTQMWRLDGIQQVQ